MSGLSWPRWAGKMAAAHGLSDGEARMLAAIAAHAGRDGETIASEAALAAHAGRKPRSARRLLAQLEQRGLVSTERRGRRTAIRRLHDVLPVDQLTLDMTPVDRPTGHVRPANRPTGQPANSCAPLTGHPGDRGEYQEGTTEQQQDAREPGRSSSGVLAETLPEVLNVLGGAPGVTVVDMAVDAMLRGHPEAKGYDHLAAAHTVVAWASEPGLGASSASRLLQRALTRQRTAPAAAGQPAGAQRGRRTDPAREERRARRGAALDRLMATPTTTTAEDPR